MTGQLFEVNLDELDDGTNVRPRADTGLRRSIETHGVLQPITVARSRGLFVVLYGHRRVAAARALGLLRIPAILEPTPDALPLRQIVENIDRQPLNPVDVARALRAHLDAHPGMTQVELARDLGRSGYYVSRKLALLELDPAVRDRVATGAIGENRALDARVGAGPAKRSRPRILQLDTDASRSRSVVVPLPNTNAGGSGRATIGVDLDDRHVDLVVEDGSGRTLMFSLSPAEAKLLGRRLLQAWQAVASLAASSRSRPNRAAWSARRACAASTSSPGAARPRRSSRRSCATMSSRSTSAGPRSRGSAGRSPSRSR
ncbi:MAG TPA: ParB/RepB/Spo0J family partition protein [Verrucomicrobiae bacterium]|nr:ParB/RepB/Spo0J family partition protein [Verrucomicrobiae bacterium]